MLPGEEDDATAARFLWAPARYQLTNLRPLSLSDPELSAYLAEHGFRD